MADPITIMTVASSAMSAIGAIQQGEAAQAQAQAEANAARRNALIKEMQAGVERQQANIREEQQRRQARGLLGRQRAAVAQAGIGFGGSALDVMEDSANKAELDSLTIRYEGDLRSRGLLADAESDRYAAEVAIVKGKNAKKAAYISAGASILSGAAAGYGGFTGSTAGTAGGSGFTGTGSAGLKMSGGTGLNTSGCQFGPSMYGLR
jgi:hypothetical protein